MDFTRERFSQKLLGRFNLISSKVDHQIFNNLVDLCDVGQESQFEHFARKISLEKKIRDFYCVRSKIA